MDAEEAEELLARGRELYHRLLEEAEELLRNLDTLSPEAIGEALQRRQDLVEALQRFDARFIEAPSQSDGSLAEFREFQKEVTKRILEVDGLVIALAREKQDAVKGQLAKLSKSAAALQAYEEKGTPRRRFLTDSVF